MSRDQPTVAKIAECGIQPKKKSHRENAML